MPAENKKGEKKTAYSFSCILIVRFKSKATALSDTFGELFH